MVSLSLQIPGLGEGAEASVVSLLDVIGETAAGQFFQGQMIPYAITAYSFFITGVCAVTIF